MAFIASSACSVWSSVRTSETLPLLLRSSVNAGLSDIPSVFPRSFSGRLFIRYAVYLANRVVASYSFQGLASKNISMLSFIPPTWIKTSTIAHSFAEKIANTPGARFVPSAQKACWIPTVFAAMQISLDILNLSFGEKFSSLKKLRNFCEQVANKLNALFFAQMALYSFSKVGGVQKSLSKVEAVQKSLIGIVFLVLPFFIGKMCAKQDTGASDEGLLRGIVCSFATSLILGKYVKTLSWIPQSQAHLAIGALSCWSAFQSATLILGYYGD